MFAPRGEVKNGPQAYTDKVTPRPTYPCLDGRILKGECGDLTNKVNDPFV
jgi:hypothetical protein